MKSCTDSINSETSDSSFGSEEKTEHHGKKALEVSTISLNGHPPPHHDNRHPLTVRVSLRLLIVSFLVPVITAFAVGRFTRNRISHMMGQTLISSGRFMPAGGSSGSGDSGESMSGLPPPTTAKKIPNTTYTSKQFGTGLTRTSDSRLIRSTSPVSSTCSASETDKNVIGGDGDNDEEEEYQPAGQHLLVDIENVDATFLNSKERLAQSMIELIGKSDLTMLSYHCHRLDPMGVSCVGVLLESHVSFHTWPLQGVITLDLFTCGSKSLLPLLSSFENLFGIPRQQQSATGGDEVLYEPPHMLWAYKKRGFPNRDEEEVNKEEIDMTDGLLGVMDYEKRPVASVQTKFQKIDVWDIIEPRFRSRESYLKSLSNDGSYESQHPELYQPERIIYLDSIMQSRAYGEAAYHEALVHPIMFAHEKPKRVAIIGGGEGATLREVLKHNTVEKVVMIEIDEMMVNISRTHLPEWSDCSNLVKSAPSCYEDPRTEVHYENAIAWFINRFLHEEADKEDLFDVIIMDALDPDSVVEFSDMLYKNDNLITSFYKALSEEGVLVMQIGVADDLVETPDTIDTDDPFLTLLENFEEVGFESITDYDESHGRFDEPWSFLAVMKDSSARSRWFASEAKLNLEIQQRAMKTKTSESPFHFFDGATMMSYQFPSRISEEVWCRREPKPEVCKSHGFDPSVPNAPVSSFDVKESLVVNGGGRGVFAKEQILEGSYIGLEECVNGMYVPPSTLELMWDFHEFDHTYWKTLVSGYVDGYGWVDNSYGEPSAGVDPGILTFANHGCDGSYNFGSHLGVTELHAVLGSGPLANDYDEENDVYDPYSERHFPNWDCSSSKALRTIELGEEMLDNYLVHGGVVHGDNWEENLSELKMMCSGAGVGPVYEYEQVAAADL